MECARKCARFAHCAREMCMICTLCTGNVHDLHVTFYGGGGKIMVEINKNRQEGGTEATSDC